MVDILDFVPIERLPPTLRTISRLIASGTYYPEIAQELGISEAEVAQLVQRLRRLLIKWALERADEMSGELRALIEHHRRHLGATARAAAGVTT